MVARIRPQVTVLSIVILSFSCLLNYENIVRSLSSQVENLSTYWDEPYSVCEILLSILIKLRILCYLWQAGLCFYLRQQHQ